MLLFASSSKAVVFLDTADPAHNVTTPGDNSGWQYEGNFNTELGVPIAPFFFIGAEHLGANAVGHAFVFHGDSYTTIAVHDIPGTDLRIWEVDHSKPFPSYAPLSTGAVDIGSTATVIGRGTRRGEPFLLGADAKGWSNGATDNVQRWGRNVIEGEIDFGPRYGKVLYCDFNNPGIENECHLTTGDSGGGLFVLENGLWRLAGINLSVDEFRVPPSGPRISAPLFDLGGLEYEEPVDTWNPIPDTPEDHPSSFYCSRISAYLPQIIAITGGDGSLAPENFNAWQKLYFTPTEITNPAVVAPLADPDSDGIGNLLEFALNLDPTFNEHAAMTPTSGLRGMPSVRLETLAGDRLTIEFVRRTPASGAGLTYIAEFSTDLVTWQAVGTETATSINPRWDRVKIADSLTTNDEVKRFVRLRVVLSP